MKQIVSLLEEKMQFLEKFFAINEIEILNFSSGDFDNVEAFYNAREQLLAVIREIDKQTETLNAETDKSPSDKERRQVSDLLNRKDRLVEDILTQDLQVLALIESEKSKIIKELQQVAKTRRAMGAYQQGSTGGQIDEKA